MRGVFPWAVAGLVALLISIAAPMRGQQGPDEFRWVDFHLESDRDTVTWVTRSLEPEKWTAIREIGVEFDSALVVTTLRATPQSSANADTFTVWNASLTTHAIAPLVKGVNLRWLDWMNFLPGARPEPAALYDSCSDCAPDTFFTAFYYDISQHMWNARWLRGGQGAPVWSGNPPEGVTANQVYAVLHDFNGNEFISTWTQFDYGKQKPTQDFIYRYDLDSFSRLERTLPLLGKEAEAMKQRLCHATDVAAGMARGQDSVLCQTNVKPRPERKPVTTPPANNRGLSVPPGARH
ncbi:MAG: hypothetical protein ABSG51_02230 [Terracidiphilus sp.]|jgi:hypothetical protein